MTQAKTPATPAEAEALAVRFLTEYLNACQIQDRSQLGNYLMKLASVTGVLMAKNEGSETAAQRLEGTAEFLRRSMPANPSELRPVQ